MKKNRILACLAAVALSSATLFGVAAPAFADDETTTEVAPVVEVAAPAAVEAPAEEPAAEPPAEPAPEPVAEVPAEPAAEEPVAEEPAAEEPPAETPPAEELASDGSAERSAPDATSSFAISIDVAAAPENDKKVYVCKIVASDNAPGGFQMQTGQNPIYVSINSIGSDVNDTGTFNDQQPSFIVPSNDASLCAHTEVIVEEDVDCPTEADEDGVVNITTTTRYYLGTTVVLEVVEHSTRPLTEDELENCDGGDNPLVASASISFTDPTCDAGAQVILGTATNATWGLVTYPTDTTYSVTATRIGDALFAGALLERVFSGDRAGPLDPAEHPECDLPTEAEVLASATATNQTCSASGTLNVVLAEHVLYWNGEEQLTAASTPKAPGNYTVTATVDDPESYTILGPTEWALTIAPATNCVTTAGLASTGTTTPFGGLLAGMGLLFLGSAAFYLRRRFGATSK